MVKNFPLPHGVHTHVRCLPYSGHTIDGLIKVRTVIKLYVYDFRISMELGVANVSLDATIATTYQSGLGPLEFGNPVASFLSHPFDLLELLTFS